MGIYGIILLLEWSQQLLGRETERRWNEAGPVTFHSVYHNNYIDPEGVRDTDTVRACPRHVGGPARTEHHR